MTSPTLSKPAALRRTRYGVQTFAFLFAVTACCALAAVLGDRFPKRFDATATREHELSPRTRDLLSSLSGEYELVVAANFSGLDPTSARRTQDVLDNIARSTSKVRTTVIDVSSSRGLTQLDELMGRLVERFKTELDKQAQALKKAEQAGGPIGESLLTLSDQLLGIHSKVKDSDPNAEPLKRFLQDSAAVCRVASEDLAKGLQTLRAGTQSTSRVPAYDDQLANIRRPLAQALEQVAKISENLDAIARTTDDKLVAQSAREGAVPAAATAVGLRKSLGETIAAIDEQPRTPAGSVARALERSSAAIVIGPPGSARGGVTSIDLGAIYPPKSVAGAAPQQIDLRARTEELLSGAIASLARTDSPIVVFVHGRNVRLTPDFVPVAPIVDRLRLRGVDVAEWPAGLDSDGPALKSIDPTGTRPVVYVIISMAPNTAEDGARLAKLARATKQLIADGKRVLLCAVPSSLPGTGQQDPMVEMLSPLGVSVDTGRPLLHQVRGPKGRVVSPDLLIVRTDCEHQLSKAIDGLPLLMSWTLPIRVTQSNGVTHTPMVLVNNDAGNTWGEAEFIGFLQIPPAQQAMIVNPPAPNSNLDDLTGPWPVVLGIERTVNGNPQRVLVVASNRWMSADVIGAESVEESRRVLQYPGNMELFDGGVSWLAGQEQMIATSAQARAVATIPVLQPGTITALRWMLIGGLPILILLVGAGWRLIRG